VRGNGINWALCKSAPRSRQITTPTPHHSVFTTRCYASAGGDWKCTTWKCRTGKWHTIVFFVRHFLSCIFSAPIRGTSHGPVSVSVSVRLGVTSRSSTKTAKQRITWTTPHNSPGTLVFWSWRSPRNSTWATPYEGAECRWGGSKSETFD